MRRVHLVHRYDEERHPDGRLSDEARFLRTWLEHPLKIGAVSPSSRALASAMARAVDPRLPGPVIELGPGTGPVTEALIRRGVAQDRLILVEFDPVFCVMLARRFPEARVVQGDAYDLAATLDGLLDSPAAAIVSSLPLLVRPEPVRVELLADGFRMLAPGAPFIQFTYGPRAPIPRAIAGIGAKGSKPIWLNLPPARVWVYREDASAPRPRSAPKSELFGKLRAGTRKVTLGVTAGLRAQGEKIRRDWRERSAVEPEPAFALLRRIGERRKDRQ